MRELCVSMPLPPAALRPNGRACWQERARVAKRVRRAAAFRARACMSAAGLESVRPVGYVIRWRAASRGWLPDADNAVASCKACLDGCADAFRVDDREWELLGVERTRGVFCGLELVFMYE